MIKKIALLSIAILFFNCAEDPVNNDVLPFISVNESINLNLPKYLNLLVPGNWVYIDGGLNGVKGIIVYNIDGSQYRAFDRSCPHLKPSNCTQMVVQDNVKMVCTCDASEFNILNGHPFTNGITHSAREYLVNVITSGNGSVVLQITNF